jgi:hypothetical protein
MGNGDWTCSAVSPTLFGHVFVPRQLVLEKRKDFTRDLVDG